MSAKQYDGTLGMVERVARAIVGPHRPVPAGSMYTLDQLRAVRWGQVNNAGRQNALNAARAAIAAMREPTEAMVDAGGDEEVFADGAAYMSLGHVAVEAYQAMIDAALAEQQS